MFSTPIHHVPRRSHLEFLPPLTSSTMDALLKEIDKIEKIASSSSSKGKAPSMIESLDSLLQTLRNTKAQCEAGEVPVSQIMQLPSAVEKCKKDVDDRHKEIYSSLARFGKTLDKVGMGLCIQCVDALTSPTEIHESAPYIFRLV